MSRTITVRGVAKASAKPDYVVLSMILEVRNKDYEKAMSEAVDQLDKLKVSLEGSGFEKDALKTSSFDVRTDYSQVQDGNGNYRREFNGYVVTHGLKLAFGFDSERLGAALSTVASSLANPQMNIAFTVEDPTVINEDLLRSASISAKRKAEVLCEASGVELGALLKIDYNWEEMHLFSGTHYDMAQEAMPMMARGLSMDIEPEDIEISDSAAFVWEIR